MIRSGGNVALRTRLGGGQVSDGRERLGRSDVHIQQLARLRHTVYRLLAGALLYPEEPLVAAIAETARELRSTGRWAAELAFFTPLDRFLNSAEAMEPEHLQELRKTYTALFVSNAGAKPIPLLETGYLDQVALISGDIMGDLEREYAAAGVSVSSPRGGTSDHIAVELEFLSFLCRQEAEALDSGDTKRVQDIVQRQVRFLANHPCRWFPSLARAVSARDDSSLYYHAVQAARAITAHDVDFHKTLIEHLSGKSIDG